MQLRDQFRNKSGDECEEQRLAGTFAAAVPGYRESCLHGGPPPSEVMASGLYHVTIECVKGLIEMRNTAIRNLAGSGLSRPEVQERTANSELEYMFAFWRDNMHMVTESSWKMQLAVAVDATANADHTIARHHIRMALFLWGAHRYGHEGWRAEVTAQHISSAVKKRIIKWLKRTDTDLGVILFLQEMIPCGCLDALAARARTLPPERRCVYCGIDGHHTHVMRCSRCRAVAYCTPEHQRLDWPHHKHTCKWVCQDLAARRAATRDDFDDRRS